MKTLNYNQKVAVSIILILVSVIALLVYAQSQGTLTNLSH